jgi:hypothetical protein
MVWIATDVQDVRDEKEKDYKILRGPPAAYPSVELFLS